jgi:DNA-binding NarL/FixJ family response regulator
MQPTARQREVMLLVALGLSNKETARRLGITEGTVKIHLQDLRSSAQNDIEKDKKFSRQSSSCEA